MKKFLTLLLILAMVFTFAACGGGDDTTGGDGDAAAVMHMGSLATNGRYQPKNLIHYLTIETFWSQQDRGAYQRFIEDQVALVPVTVVVIVT